MKRVLAACAIIAALLAPPAEAANTVRSSAQPLIGNVANGTISYDFMTNESVLGAEITGLAATGATLTIEGSTDGRRGSDPAKVWFATVGIPFTCPSPSTFTTITADGPFKLDVSGLTNLRFRVSSVGSSAGPMLVSVNAIEGATLGSCGGSGGGGSSGGNVNIHDSSGGALTSTGGALNVAGTLTATLGSFTPALSYLASSMAVTSTSSTVALPSGFSAGQVAKIYNLGPYPLIWTFGTTAGTNMGEIAPYCWDSSVIPSGATNIAALTKTAGQTASLNISLGAGLPAGGCGPIDLAAAAAGTAFTFADGIAGIDNSSLSQPYGSTVAGTSSTKNVVPVQGVTGGVSQNVDTPTSGNNLYAAVTAPIPPQVSHGVNIGGVEGLAAGGSAVAGDPVLIGGSDGTNARSILTSTAGHVVIDCGSVGGSCGASVGNITQWAGGTLAAPTAPGVPQTTGLVPTFNVGNSNNNGAALPGGSSPVTPSNNPVGSAAMATGQVSCGTSSTSLSAARTGIAGTGRVSVTVTNLGTTDVEIGNTGVTTTTGDLLVGVKGASKTFNTTAALFCVAGTAQSVSFQENF